MTLSMKQAKQRLRAELLHMRRQLPLTYRQQRSREVCEQLIALPEFKQATSFVFYMSIHGEVDLTDAIEKTWQAGKRVLLPRVHPKEKQIHIYQVDHWGELETGAYEIREPSPRKCSQWLADQVDLVVVPGVAFDQQGHRLGYGGGYYDRFLVQAHEARRIGVAYPEQIVTTVYPQHHDQPMDQILKGNK